jgi:hypothetical protein
VFSGVLLYDWVVISVFSERRYGTGHPMCLLAAGSGWKREDLKLCCFGFIWHGVDVTFFP